ncbi:Fic family protein [Haloactinopolyspora alba]|uniref:Fic family protein n=1 Tax=Haloactinopolyspora alba TaxID=648780 RepID=A0A2P8E285_9ACTN|nr:Fic family protein [Haloactinopolyspora alba]PSL03588.1 Fic family protein [Haloactinopolyspora alba]
MASDPVWPALTWEQLNWHPTVPDELVPRRVRDRHTGDYEAAVPPRIAALDVSLPSSVLAMADEASIEIARLDAELGTDVAPFSALLLRSESTSSSQIENLTSGARAIALAELGEGERSNATQIVANVHAMRAAVDLADRLDGDAVLAMHAALMEHQPDHEPGRWRRQQVWIGGSNFGPHQAVFVPPHHRHVPAAMGDLIEFVRRDDVPVLVHAAVAHAQFETIHPFTDGNGRTGRALVHSILRARHLTDHVTVPVSAGLLTDTDGYFDALTAYRAGDPAPIVTSMAEAAFTAIANGRQLVRDLTAARERWNGLVDARRDAVAWRLADLLLRQPVINAAIVRHDLGATSANAHRAIRQLAEAGVITEFTGKRRTRLWQCGDVLAALDDFAARAGRRTPAR